MIGYRTQSMLPCLSGALVWLLVMSSGTGCSNAHNTLPIAKIERQLGVTLLATESANVPELRMVSHRIERYGERNFHVADMILLNPLDVPITYRGYRMDSWETRPAAGEISPLYSRQIRTSEDPQWHAGFTGYCGTGAGTMVVPPKHAGSFKAQIELPVLSAKVGFTCSWQTADSMTRETVVWSTDLLEAPAVETQDQGLR